MKKKIIFSILTYLLLTINSSAVTESLNKNNTEDKKILKVGVLLPLTGEFQDIGESFLKAIQLALHDIENKNIKIFLKDSKGSALGAYQASKEFQDKGIKIVIGPIFYESLERLNEINDITFISFTNKTEKIPQNTIAFGINIVSQINVLKKYFIEKDFSKTILLSPKNDFVQQAKIIKDNQLKLYKFFLYDMSPKKITSEIEKLTKYRERKNELKRRVNKLKKSDLYKDEQELKILEQKHTLGKINFDSVIIVDFGERLKSVLTSFMFADVSSNEVYFFTVNQWFDESFFNESALQNLYFPAIDLKNYKKFSKKYTKTFDKNPNKVSILAYDALGLIYYCWSSNNFEFKKEQLFNKKGFKGLHGQFTISNNRSNQKLKIYKVSKKKFIKVY
jgi:ABC-type branched-subunit amino acid transport system substrate-binding protein